MQRPKYSCCSFECLDNLVELIICGSNSIGCEAYIIMLSTEEAREDLDLVRYRIGTVILSHSYLDRNVVCMMYSNLGKITLFNVIDR